MSFIKNKRVAPAAAVDEARHQARDYQGLVSLLGDTDGKVRRWAARDLQQHANASAVLLQQLRREDDRAVREIIFTSLTRLGDAVAVAGLMDCLRSEDVPLRNEAIEAMKALPLAVAPIMGGLLRDPDADVRIMAIGVLESLCHPHVEKWLLEVIADDPEVNVCGAALDVLCEVASESAGPALMALLQRFKDQPYIQFAAGIALARIAKG